MTKNLPSAADMADRILTALKREEILDLTSERNQQTLQRIISLLLTEGFQSRSSLSKSVTLLLSDIRGFSEIAGSYPAAGVVKMLNRYFACMGDVIVRYNGTIDKLMGDSILVAFGMNNDGDNAEKDGVENAIACAVEMQLAMSQFNKTNESHDMPALYMGIGINTGMVWAGDLGSKHYSEYTVIGDAVNLTSRIETHCLRGQILISQNTYLQAESFVEVGPPNHIQVKGVREPVTLYELMETSKPHTMTVPRREERKSPRVDVNIPIYFQILHGKIIVPERIRGTIVNIAYNGLLVESSIKLSKLSEIKTSLTLELFGDKTTDIYARILSTEESEGGYRSSVEFTSINNEGQRAIKELVDQMMLTT